MKATTRKRASRRRRKQTQPKIELTTPTAAAPFKVPQLSSINIAKMLSGFMNFRTSLKDLSSSLQRVESFMDSAYRMFELASQMQTMRRRGGFNLLPQLPSPKDNKRATGEDIPIINLPPMENSGESDPQFPQFGIGGESNPGFSEFGGGPNPGFSEFGGGPNPGFSEFGGGPNPGFSEFGEGPNPGFPSGSPLSALAPLLRKFDFSRWISILQSPFFQNILSNMFKGNNATANKTRTKGANARTPIKAKRKRGNS